MLHYVLVLAALGYVPAALVEGLSVLKDLLAELQGQRKLPSLHRARVNTRTVAISGKLPLFTCSMS